MAQRCGQQVSTVIVVAHTAEECDEFGVVLVTAHKHLAFLLGILTRTHVVGAKTIVREVFVLSVES